jgi:hypothetical protein
MQSRVDYLFEKVNPIQALAWVYAAMFLFVVSLGYIPGFTNDQGQLFGLFKIDLIDDALHLGSGIWAALAAWTSARAATLYFKIFGIVYGLDGVIGLLFGQGYLDGGIFINGPAPLDWGTKIAANTPHILIGGTAVVIGFVLSQKWANRA